MLNEARASLFEKVQSWMDLSPEGQRCKAKIEEDAKAKRAQLHRQIEALRMKEELQVFPLRQALEEAKGRERAAQRTLLDATALVNQAYAAYREEYLAVSIALDWCESELRKVADPRIDMFIKEIEEEFETRRNNIYKTLSLPLKKDKYTDVTTVRYFSNEVFVDRWAKRIREVIDLAKELKLKSVEDLDLELKVLRDSIPKEAAADLECIEYVLPVRESRA